MVRPDPVRAARAIAADLHAQVAIGGAETELALAQMSDRQLEHRDLDDLAAAMRRADHIRDRTRVAESARVCRSLNTKVAIHPDTLRRAAAELIAAEEALVAAHARDHRRERRRRWGRAGGGLGTVGAGTAVALAVAVAPGVAIGAVGAGAALAAQRRARRADPPIHVSLAAHRATAESRWEQVAGVGADPADVESIIRRYDPQDSVVADLVANSPAVRAADRLAVARRVAWVAAWRREVGDDGPVADPAMSDLLGRDRTELWLGADRPGDVDADTLVVAAPYADLPEDRARQLHRQLLDLPRRQRVIVVLAPDPDAPNGTRIPGVGWVPALDGG